MVNNNVTKLGPLAVMISVWRAPSLASPIRELNNYITSCLGSTTPVVKPDTILSFKVTFYIEIFLVSLLLTISFIVFPLQDFSTC